MASLYLGYRKRQRPTNPGEGGSTKRPYTPARDADPQIIEYLLAFQNGGAATERMRHAHYFTQQATKLGSRQGWEVARR